MILIDTSVWIDVQRDRSGLRAHELRLRVDDQAVLMPRVAEFELLTGARDEIDWSKLCAELELKQFADLAAGRWRDAARIGFDLRRRGLTVASRTDFLIAQLALDHDALLLHRDSDFCLIAQVRPLQHEYLAWREFA